MSRAGAGHDVLTREKTGEFKLYGWGTGDWPVAPALCRHLCCAGQTPGVPGGCHALLGQKMQGRVSPPPLHFLPESGKAEKAPE